MTAECGSVECSLLRPGMLRRRNLSTVALFLGAGFSKSWGLPLSSEIMDMESVRKKVFPGKWQRKLLVDIERVWKSTVDKHNGVFDDFARLPEITSTEMLTSFLSLRLSSEHWHVGTAHETRWATGDHIRKRKDVPHEYRNFLSAFSRANLLGIVTTNYDIVVEKLLGPRPSGRMGGFNYGIAEEQLLSRHAVSSQWSYGPVIVSGVIPLLKLHGSLNWALSDDRSLVKYIDCRPSRGRKYEVVLLPPAASDKFDILQPIRNYACNVLSNAEVWVFCGYSFPDYDKDVHDLVKKAASGLVSKVCVCDINPKPVCERLSALFAEVNRSVPIEPGHGITSDFDVNNARQLSQLLVPIRKKPGG